MWWHQKRKPGVVWRGFAHIYAFVARYEQKSRLERAVDTPIPMISVGNITVGGSGKTPFVVWLAAALQNKGFQPVLLSRGDGANNQIPHVVSAYSQAKEIGDEAVLLYRLGGCPVIAGRDRVLAASMAKELGDVLILDDGFQYRQLHRVCDIVLVPAEGVGNGYVLPAGPLREPVSALSRADIVVRSGSSLSPKAVALTTAKEWSWTTQNKLIRDWNQVCGASLTLDMPIQTISSIARPQRFIQSLKQLGFDIQQTYIFPDHHAFTAEDVQGFGSAQWVTTGKDAVKLLPLWDQSKPLWVLEQEAVAEDGLLETIIRQLEKARLS